MSDKTKIKKVEIIDGYEHVETENAKIVKKVSEPMPINEKQPAQPTNAEIRELLLQVLAKLK